MKTKKVKTSVCLALCAAALTAVAVPGKPYSHLNYLDDPEEFHFAIVGDRQGADKDGNEFRGGFTNAIRVVNMLRPEFVMSVGDLIPYGWFREASVREQHRSLDRLLDQFIPPFFYVVGNHDIAPSQNKKGLEKCNEISTKVWRELRGDDYYSFVYKGCLFVALNTIDNVRLGTTHLHITEKQYAWFKDVLAKNRDARWTFIFMHQPAVWDTKRWLDFELENLVDRKYTVFAGDWHSYLHAKRHGHDYYVLAVCGGTSGVGVCGLDFEKRAKLLGRDYGDVEHIMWVTMTKDGPVIANIELDGVLPHDFLDQKRTLSMGSDIIKHPVDYPVDPDVRKHQKALQERRDAILSGRESYPVPSPR